MRANPECWKTDDAEDEICEELCGCHAGFLGDGVRDALFVRGIPREQNEIDAFASDPGLEAVPVTQALECILISPNLRGANEPDW